MAAEAAVAAEHSNDPSSCQAGDSQADAKHGAKQGSTEPETGDWADAEITRADQPAAEQAHSESQTKDTDDVQMAGPDSPAGRQAGSGHETRQQADRPTACQQPQRRLETHVWHAKRMKMVQR